MQQITLPAATDEELLSLLSVPDTCENLNDFLKCFDLPLSLLQTEEALEEAVYLILSEMKEDGVIYAELRFAPQLHTQKEMTQETAIHAALRGLKRAPIPGNLILCCMRGDLNQKENLETLELAKKYLVEIHNFFLLLNLSYFPSFFGQFLYFFTSLTVDIIIIAHGKMINGLLSFQYGKMLLFIHFIYFLFILS